MATNFDSLGEFGWISRLQKAIQPTNKSTIYGIGDDAAVLAGTEEEYKLLASDMLVEGVHFDVRYSPLKHLGYKAVVVNISDIYAMNGQPEQIVVSLAISSKYTVEAVEAIYEGMLLACKIYGVDLVGGDTTTSPAGLSISIAAYGSVKKDKITYRNGANSGDLVVVSGDLGGAYMGLQVLEREKSVFLENKEVQPDLSGHDYILERQLKPEARKDVIEMFEKMELKPTAMIDISDGLASEAIHIAAQSGMGVTLHEEKIPIDPSTYNTARDFNLDPTVVALNGGEDYELLFTISQSDYDKIKGSPHFTPVGYITADKEVYRFVDRQNGEHELQAQGWDAFLSKNKDVKGDKEE
ncbi:thiamine-phosphate kinase [Luteibaculum oceani]|uniref:Thiamine-monophosphate kinase n=1 Tax=Luteibaculum oceani TaxID=1294296 RepID=A0A5C6VLR9_9FLAO|nr:thiamine-phosphate kinase [Luteibaculum oceani]TXC85446.1 thiamine-phosphate kinase [Luteibaculum oceani]